MASRPYQENERSNLLNARRGDISNAALEHIIAMDGIAVIVHPSSPVRKISISQLADVFSCNISNWSILGGADLPIDVCIRDEKSGTHSIFKEEIMSLFDRNFCPSIQIFKTNEALSQAVRNNPAAIGFVPFSGIKDNQALTLISEGGIEKSPNLFDVALENYPLSRRLYLYTAKSEKKSQAADFIKFCLSNKGQTIVDSIGFVSLNPEPHLANYQQMDTSARKDLPIPYQKATQNARLLPISIRFNNSTIRIDNKGIVDLKRISTLLKQEKDSEVILIGFSDDQNEPFIQQELSLSRADAVKRELINAGIDEKRLSTIGLGNIYPVATNKNELGRARNRRVEVWLK